MSTIPESWREVFVCAGITAQDLLDPATSKEVLKFVGDFLAGMQSDATDGTDCDCHGWCHGSADAGKMNLHADLQAHVEEADPEGTILILLRCFSPSLASVPDGCAALRLFSRS